jgi:hypothetical protein
LSAICVDGGLTGDDLTQVPPDLDQTFSSVREAQARLMQAAAALGITSSFNFTPRQMVAEFYKRDPKGDIDRIYAQLLQNAPAIKQADAKLLQARQNLSQAQLNLLLQDRGRDRWRRYAAQRQSGQQRGCRSKPDGGPLDQRHLDRCQF